MASYTHEFCVYSLSGNQTGMNNSFQTIKFNQVQTGYTAITGLTLDAVTNVGQFTTAADFATTWDHIRFSCFAQGSSDLGGSQGHLLRMIDLDDTEVFVPQVSRMASNRTNASCQFKSGWLPTWNSKTFSAQSRSWSDTSWTLLARETYTFTHLEVEVIKAL